MKSHISGEDKGL